MLFTQLVLYCAYSRTPCTSQKVNSQSPSFRFLIRNGIFFSNLMCLNMYEQSESRNGQFEGIRKTDES